MSPNAAIPSLMPTYSRIDLAFERGEGAWLYTHDGRRFLDFTSGVAVNGLGHCHSHLVKTLQEQAARLWHVSNLFRIDEAERLADRLVAHSFAETVFVCNSGAEAMEACIKVARRFQFCRGQPERNRIITFEGGFHGRTMATISAVGGQRLTEGFAPLLDGFDHVPFADHDALEAAVTEQTAAIMIEPVMGEGGARPIPKVCLEGLRALCDRHDILLIFDEVQSGMGRTGHLFAHQAMGVTPDIMGLAKGLGGGFPIGACLATARAASGMTAGTHGSTFGGNPLGSAVASAVLDVMLEDGFLAGIVERGRYMRERAESVVERHPHVFELARGAGMLLGLKARGNNVDVVSGLRARGLLTAPAADNIVRLLPPLTITLSEIDTAIEAIEAYCAEQTA